jgi:hypothetical protein
MADFAPQHNLYKVIGNLRTVAQWIFWLILVFSIIPVSFKEFCDKHNLLHLVSILNIIGISIYFIIETTIEYILLPLADSKRRDDFIDNSFGSMISTNSSVGYYDNDEVNQGLYKAAVNLFENCFFTFSLVRIMTIRKIVVPSVMLILIVVFAYYGFKEVPFALTILQALFSASILGELVKHLILINRLSNIQDSWVSLFHNEDLKQNTLRYHAHIYRYWLQYEALHSKINANIPDGVFNTHNENLTDEWGKMKSRYRII